MGELIEFPKQPSGDEFDNQDEATYTSRSRTIGKIAAAGALSVGAVAGIGLISHAQRESFNEHQQNPDAPSIFQEIPSQEDYDNGLVDTSIYGDRSIETENIGASPTEISIYFDEADIQSVPVHHG